VIPVHQHGWDCDDPSQVTFSNHGCMLGSVSLLAFLEDTNLDWDMPEDGIFTINDIRLILRTFL
jgi:hypothetical protein